MRGVDQGERHHALLRVLERVAVNHHQSFEGRNEADRIVADYYELEAQARLIGEKLPEEYWALKCLRQLMAKT